MPVGEDQRQHLELARDVALHFNRRFELDLFPAPEAVPGRVVRVMSLRDGAAKMSKSAESDMSRINLDDGDDAIAKKVKKCKTDLIGAIYADSAARPEVTNLINIYAALTETSIE